MLTNQEEAKFSLDDLIALADQIKAKYGTAHAGSAGMIPFDLLRAMSAQILAAYIPNHGQAFLDRQHDQIEMTFACEMLSINGLPSTLWLSVESQRAFYGGIEPLLFQKLPAGIFTHYQKLLGRNRQDDDPLNWDAVEIG